MMYIYTGFVEEECDFTPQFMNIRHYYTAIRPDDRDSGSVMVGESGCLSHPPCSICEKITSLQTKKTFKVTGGDVRFWV